MLRQGNQPGNSHYADQVYNIALLTFDRYANSRKRTLSTGEVEQGDEFMLVLYVIHYEIVKINCIF